MSYFKVECSDGFDRIANDWRDLPLFRESIDVLTLEKVQKP